MKLYIYREARSHIHDKIDIYKGVVPLSVDGIAKHCRVVTNPDDAEYYYIGQFDDNCPTQDIDPNKFLYYKNKPERHIVDIEGDQPNRDLISLFRNCIITANSVHKRYKNLKVFVRPTFSALLMDLVKRNDSFTLPNYRSFGFKGFLSHASRIKVAQAIDKIQLPCEIKFNNQWTNQDVDLSSDNVIEYEEMMKNHAFSLCVRGNGLDSSRYFESCAYGRIPIVVSDGLLFGHTYDLSFAIQLSDKLSVEDLAKEFNKIFCMTDQEIINRCVMARRYFEDVIRPYFSDPTVAFLSYLKENNL